MKLFQFLKNWKKMTLLTLIFVISSFILVFFINALIAHSVKDKKFSYDSIDNVEYRKVAIVFGAGLYNNEPSYYLKDRVTTAVNLYKAGKVDKIIMSGDNRFVDYNEPQAMIDLALKMGVPEAVLQPDYAGRRTYDTCLRAKKIFKVDEAILVTQDFHMTRALYTCQALGIDSIGVTSDMSEYPSENWYKLRDKFALIRAIWETKVDSPDNVVMGDTIHL